MSKRDQVLRAAHTYIQKFDWIAAYRLANDYLNEDPDRPEALYVLGTAARGMGHIGLAYTILRRALAGERKQPNLWMAYAATLHDLNKYDEAREAFDIVQKALPDDPMPPANIGAGYVQLGKYRDAIKCCERALALDAENYIAQISMAFSCLALGRWKDAWQYNGALYGNHLETRIYTEAGEPEWDGAPGKTVVVQCDQGVGDIIMFAQCIPQMQRDCKEVIVECAERLVPFFKRNFPGVIVYGTLKQKHATWPKDHAIDARIHISYLGKFYRNADADFPRKPYITAAPERVAKWKAWLERFPKPWVGIAWQGGIQATQKHLRSIELHEYAPIMATGGTFVDLSYHDAAGEVAKWNIDNVEQIVRPEVDTKDFEDTIALIAALDDVVTVTTTAAHVCGALGKHAYVLAPHVPTWRYAYRCGDGLIWYPEGSVTLYRRLPEEADWSNTINRVTRDLERVRKLRRAA